MAEPLTGARYAGYDDGDRTRFGSIVNHHLR